MGLLEIRRYPEVQRHECHQLLPRRDVTAKGNGFLRHVPGKRRDQACIADVELRLFDLSLQGFQACFGPRDLHPGDVNLRCRPAHLFFGRLVLCFGIVGRGDYLIELGLRDGLGIRSVQRLIALKITPRLAGLRACGGGICKRPGVAGLACRQLCIRLRELRLRFHPLRCHLA